jgi:ribosome-associated heat shock protein Hsp15
LEVRPIFGGRSDDLRRISLGEYADAASLRHERRAGPWLAGESFEMQAPEGKSGVRLDKWLWAARFFKTRSLAGDEIGKGRVAVNGQPAKASRDVRTGDLVEFRQGQVTRTVAVTGVSAIRGPAPVAQTLYVETPESIAAREKAATARRLSPEPAAAIGHGRPTKRNQRQLSDWNRWSASIEPE